MISLPHVSDLVHGMLDRMETVHEQQADFIARVNALPATSASSTQALAEAQADWQKTTAALAEPPKILDAMMKAKRPKTLWKDLRAAIVNARDLVKKVHAELNDALHGR